MSRATAKLGASDAVAAVLREAVAEGVMPGASLIVGRGDAVLSELHVGTLAGDDDPTPVGCETRYDLSSLTKPLATTAAVMLLAGRGLLDLDSPLAEWIPEFTAAAGPDQDARRRVTVRHLLAHCSGLPAHRPFYEQVAPASVGTEAGRARVHEMVLREPLEALPGERAVYSDLGFIVLGLLVECVDGRRLDGFVGEELFTPLGLHATRFADVSAARAGHNPLDDAKTAPCGSCAWRGGIVRAVVQDENAYAMGGMAGHAGLFSTAREVHAIASELMRAYAGGKTPFDARIVRAFWRRAGESVGPADSTWALGWDTPSAVGSSAGTRVSPRAVGHLGFTGTSIWLDLERGVDVVLLTNRLHPDRTNTAIRALRPRLHDTVFEGLA